MGRRIVCGDIHGNLLAFKQCLERSKFDPEKDTLILIGDIVDGWAYVYEVVEEILKLKNVIAIKGNHDDWFIDFLKDGYSMHPTMWCQGGEGTLDSYIRYSGQSHSKELVRGYNEMRRRVELIKINTDFKNDYVPQSHKDFFFGMKLWHKDHNNNFFVHGGFDRHQYIDYLTVFDPKDFYWNRKLWEQALSHHGHEGSRFRIEEDFKRIFIGHSCTLAWDKCDKPMCADNRIWNVDTGAGWYGRLTFMDVDTYEYWQSDSCSVLYPNETGR
jgi:serine/threonine protein phosphatase 1